MRHQKTSIAMKKIIYYGLPLALLLLQSACITSLQPLVTADNIVVDKRVAGNWQYNNDIITVEKMNESYIYNELTKMKIGGNDNAPHAPLQGKEKEDSIFYAKAWCVSFKKNGVDYYMSAAITRINDGLYMELLPIVVSDPQQPEGSGYEFNYDYLPTFTVAKVIINNNESISLKFLNGKYIKEQVIANRLKISHQKDNIFDSFLVTASTDELRQFLQKYGNDDRLYSNENSVTLTKKG